MRTRDHRTTAASASSLVTDAAARGIRPPFQLSGPVETLRAWLVVARKGDAIYADEYGDLWWAKPTGTYTARVVRTLWPEEAESLATAIDDGVRAVLGA